MKLQVIFLILIPGITFKECACSYLGGNSSFLGLQGLLKYLRKHGILFVKITKTIHLSRVFYIEEYSKHTYFSACFYAHAPFPKTKCHGKTKKSFFSVPRRFCDVCFSAQFLDSNPSSYFRCP